MDTDVTLRAANQMVILLARKMRDMRKVQVGINTPLVEAAAYLARTVGEPGPVVYTASVSGLHRVTHTVSLVAEEWSSLARSPLFPLETVLDLVEGHEGVDEEPVHPLQIDADGFLNLSGIKCADGSPRIIGPGPAGLDLLPRLNKGGSTIYLTRHDPRRFVERVSIRTAAAPKNSVTPDSSAVDVITNLGRFAISHGVVRLISRHRWVKASEILAATGCAVDMSAESTTTVPPTAHELTLLEKIDPHHLRTLEFLPASQRRQRCSELWRRERAEPTSGSPS